jgi:hypothetical protein
MLRLALGLGALVLLISSAVAGLFDWQGQHVIIRPPPGTPICSDWTRNAFLPKLGCHRETIERICSGSSRCRRVIKQHGRFVVVMNTQTMILRIMEKPAKRPSVSVL